MDIIACSVWNKDVPDKRMKWIPTILKREVIKRKDSIKLHWYQGKNVCSLSKKIQTPLKDIKETGAVFKGNPNFQDIFNWILQILHYCCRKNKNIKNSWIIEQNLVLSLPFALLTATCASCCLPQWQNFFIS